MSDSPLLIQIKAKLGELAVQLDTIERYITRSRTPAPRAGTTGSGAIAVFRRASGHFITDAPYERLAEVHLKNSFHPYYYGAIQIEENADGTVSVTFERKP